LHYIETQTVHAYTGVDVVARVPGVLEINDLLDVQEHREYAIDLR
jgi:hypothetical protein